MAIRRHYIETTDVPGSTEAQIQLAEELIDRYVGPQPKAMRREYTGSITSLLDSFKNIIDTGNSSQLDLTNGYLAGAVLEMVSGAAAGKREVILSSDKATKGVTLRSALSTAPAVGDYFKIYQYAKFPRAQDVQNTPDGLQVFHSIPEAVREAVIAQVKYIIAKGDAYFTGDGSDLQSESFLNYSYSRGSGSDAASALTKIISPQARTLLRGIMNRKGRIAEGPGHVGREFI